ncbi:hypothetical protein FNH05_21240 [Amycolatopsis rhizosphaerae]|uniref:Uncharacterized protein n=1 Tax=Amycolatopsis rhizosphaerae TaxID=2053003 RepID=A0A558C762_9PSEU|nr:hypothetical protein [Amycolatopsis rhizosphaerae]TVT44606.1 hypothetical protein FNH05_21240 [Amycolatopsis rhizosphaerae]
MEFIKAEWNPEWRGFWTDPSGYIAELPKLAPDLPKGALAFASHPDHYDFGSSRCVKDLKFLDVSVAVERGVCLEIRFGPNEWKHDSGLVISYAQVSRVNIRVHESGSSLQDLGTVLLDEILPEGFGCSHEIFLTGGVISISCADLNARWG